MDNEDRYQVVISDEDQYSIWPTWRDIPKGWRSDKMEGSKEECLSYIKKVWTDMKPKSLKEQETKRLV